MKHTNYFLLTITILFTITLLSCSSVFSAGVSGKIVDSESTSSPKDGIQDVEVYAYIKEETRDSDFSAWDSSKRFSPSNTDAFIGHTTTNADGTFTINKIVWEEFFPDFGKTADYCTIYLLFYHENYGLTKNINPAIIMSDTSANVVYQEITKTRESTSLAINVKDIGTENNITDSVIVKVTVPQTSGNTIYTQTITGNGNIQISYPRYSSGTTENKPNVKISVTQNGTNPKWAQCFFDKDNSKYNFFSSTDTYSVVVEGSTMNTDVYVKATTLTVPAISGQVQYGSDSPNEGSTIDDNLKVWLAYKDSSTLKLYDDSTNEVTTSSSGDGANSSIIRHGLFSGLASNVTWTDTTYTGKYAELTAYLVVDKDSSNTLTTGDKYKTIILRSDRTTYDSGIFNSTDSVY